MVLVNVGEDSFVVLQVASLAELRAGFDVEPKNGLAERDLGVWERGTCLVVAGVGDFAGYVGVGGKVPMQGERHSGGPVIGTVVVGEMAVEVAVVSGAVFDAGLRLAVGAASGGDVVEAMATLLPDSLEVFADGGGC